MSVDNSGGAVTLPNSRGLRRIAGHGVTCTGAVLWRDISVFYDLLDF